MERKWRLTFPRDFNGRTSDFCSSPLRCHQEARNIPLHRQSRFLASRGLLAELMFMLYGIGELPEIVTLPKGKPGFQRIKICLRFAVSYAREYGWRGVNNRR